MQIVIFELNFTISLIIFLLKNSYIFWSQKMLENNIFPT